MNLLELALLGLRGPGQVPAFTLGCFRRRAITFYSGATDESSLVWWLQSRTLTADLRLSPDRPRLPSIQALDDASPEVLARLLEAEGGLARTRFEAGLMSWHDWEAFQLHAKWPEPGELRRVGDCLIEFAPSGAYVEDWRFQSPGDGPFVGLRLLDERDGESGQVLHRGGGLVVCGRHALFVRGRARALPEAARLSELLSSAVRNRALREALFGCEASYAELEQGDYCVRASTLPWREGHALLDQTGFSYASETGLVTQRCQDQGRLVERRFEVDVLEPHFTEVAATAASQGAATWLSSEAETLLRFTRA